MAPVKKYPGTNFVVTEALEEYLKAKQLNPDAEMTRGAKLALDKLTDEDLAAFARQVKVKVGEPVNLTNEQNAAFRAGGGGETEIARAAEPAADGAPEGASGSASEPASKSENVPYKAPAGKFAGGGTSAGGGIGSMSNAWARFSGSFEDFKAHVLRPDPDRLHVGLQKWAVVTRIGQPLVDRMAQKVSGTFADPEEAEIHAKRLRDEFPWFDVDVVSMYHFVPYPTEEAVKRGIKRVYDDDVLDQSLRAHFDDNVSCKERQMDRISEAVERAKNPAKFRAADEARKAAGKQSEFPPLQFVPNAVDDDDVGIVDEVRCK